MKKKFTVSAGSAGGGASLGVHSARIAGNERIAAGRLARCRSIVAANQTGGCGDLGALAVPKTCSRAEVRNLFSFGSTSSRGALSRNRTISGRALRRWTGLPTELGGSYAPFGGLCIFVLSLLCLSRSLARPCVALLSLADRAAASFACWLDPLLAPRATSALSLAPRPQPAWDFALALEHLLGASGLPAPGELGWQVGRWLPSWLQGSGTALPASTTTTTSHSLLASSLGKSATQQREQEQWN